MCFSLDKFFSTSLKEREALSYRETIGFKLLGESRAKGSSFLEKLEQRFKRFKLSKNRVKRRKLSRPEPRRTTDGSENRKMVSKRE